MELHGYTKLYLAIFFISYATMPYWVWQQYHRRGYLAFGGEWFIPVLIILVLEIIRQGLCFCFEMHDEFKH